jgi:hypothetical protein
LAIKTEKNLFVYFSKEERFHKAFAKLAIALAVRSRSIKTVYALAKQQSPYKINKPL